MVGFGRFAGIGILGLALSACSSSGVIPKAFEGIPAPMTEVSAAAVSTTDSEPVIVAPEVLDGWQFLYRNITTTEFVLCLEGELHDGKLVIDGFKLARMEASTINSVRYQPCTSSRYLGTAHNHPPVDDPNKSLCYQSEPDRRSFGMDNRAVVDVVLCGDEKYYWVLKDGRSGAETATLAGAQP